MHKLITAVEGMRQLLQRPHVGIRKPDLSPSRPILWPAPQTIVLQHAKGKHSSKLVARLHKLQSELLLKCIEPASQLQTPLAAELSADTRQQPRCYKVVQQVTPKV